MSGDNNAAAHASQFWPDLKALIIRHRFTLFDVAMIGAVVASAAFGVWQFDVFPNESEPTRELTFELDEIFGICALGFALFSWSRMRAQKREIERRQTAEAEVRALAFDRDDFADLCVVFCGCVLRSELATVAQTDLCEGVAVRFCEAAQSTIAKMILNH